MGEEFQLLCGPERNDFVLQCVWYVYKKLCYGNVCLTIIMEKGSPRLQTIIPLGDVAKYFT